MKLRPLATSLIILMLIMWVISCEKPNESIYNPPEDHTVNNDGIMHKPGLNDPVENCSSCHGTDLRGGTVGVSCYECHGNEW